MRSNRKTENNPSLKKWFQDSGQPAKTELIAKKKHVKIGLIELKNFSHNSQTFYHFLESHYFIIKSVNSFSREPWPEQNKQLAKVQEEKLLESNWPHDVRKDSAMELSLFLVHSFNVNANNKYHVPPLYDKCIVHSFKPISTFPHFAAKCGIIFCEWRRCKSSRRESSREESALHQLWKLFSWFCFWEEWRVHRWVWA